MADSNAAKTGPSESIPPPGVRGIAVTLDACLEVKAEPLHATLLIRSELRSASALPTVADLERKIRSLNVVHGLDTKLLERILAEQLFDCSHIVASATPVTEGRNAFIQEAVNSQVEKKPKVLEDGSTDYKNVDNIRQVKKGEVLAVKHPAVPGTAGIDVFGHEILPQPLNDALFKIGANTSLSEDGLRLIAGKDGFLYYSNGEICVGDVYTVKGDVDFKTGNIRYQGDIHIQGDVACGFKVDADGNVLVEGSVEAGAIISRKGNVEIQKGVFGQGNCRISAHGDIRVKSAQDVRFECGGVLEVEKGIRNCLVAAGSVKTDKKGCYVIGGTLNSYADVSIAVVGAEACITELQIVDKQAEAASQRTREIDRLRQEGLPKLARLDNQLKGLAAKAGRLGGQAQIDWRAEMNATLSDYGRLGKSLAPLMEERKAFQNICSPTPGKRVGCRSRKE